MKKILCILIVCIAAYAETGGSIVAKITPSESQGYLIFSNGTYWKVSSFVKRWRTPLEWLAGNEIYVPENYICDMQSWSFGDEFEVYPKCGNIRVDESHASNEEALKKHSHILLNPRTEKILFGTPIHPADFVVQIYNEGYSLGHSKGYSTGYNEGRSSGYSQGYDSGYADGEKAARPQNIGR